MHPLLQKKSRLLALASLSLMAQCCCCIIPVGWQVNRDQPAVQAIVQRVDRALQIDLDQVRASLGR